MSLGDLFYSTGPGGLDQLALALSRTGFFHSREGFFLRRPAKGDLAVNISVSRIHTDPEPIGLVVARDVSDRKRAEDALKRVEARYESLVASTGVVVWELDRDRKLISLSPAVRDASRAGRGASGSAAGSTSWSTRRTGKSPPRFDAWSRQDEPLLRPELRVRTRAGDYLDCEFLLITRLREGAGRPDSSA